MDHLKEIQDILKRQVPKVEPGQIVYLKPDSTVALFEAQQTIEHLSQLVYLNAAESQRLHLKMREHHGQCEQRICETERDAHIRVESLQELVKDQEQQLKHLQAYCREQEQASNNKHRIRAVYLDNGGLINDALLITRVEGDSQGIVVYVKA